MKRICFLLLCVISLFLISCSNYSTKKSNHNSTLEYRYTNPIDVQFGDPYILKASDGRFYMYGTYNKTPGFMAYSSDNLKDWKSEGIVYDGTIPSSWALNCFWAPEVYEYRGKYYMFFSANWKYNPNREEENFRIGIAVSDKPTGPFVDLNNKPLFDPGYPVIDANLYIDEENDKIYLYFSRCCYKHPVNSEIADWAKKQGWFEEVEESWIYGVELASDFSGIIGEPQMLIRPPYKLDDQQTEWESRSVMDHEVNRRWSEGSFLLRHGDIFYMLYSANYFGGKNYAVGYATSKSPLGPFIKANNNPVIEKNDNRGGNVTGTGHCMVLNLEDTFLCVYHARTTKTGDERVVFMDEMTIDTDGILRVNGPTTEEQIIKIKPVSH